MGPMPEGTPVCATWGWGWLRSSLTFILDQIFPGRSVHKLISRAPYELGVSSCVNAGNSSTLCARWHSLSAYVRNARSTAFVFSRAKMAAIMVFLLCVRKVN